MICTCTHPDCYYIFPMNDEQPPRQCPDCGNPTVRAASPEEIVWFLAEHEKEARAC